MRVLQVLKQCCINVSGVVTPVYVPKSLMCCECSSCHFRSSHRSVLSCCWHCSTSCFARMLGKPCHTQLLGNQPSGESFFLSVPDGCLANVFKQVGTAAPGFCFFLFCGRNWVPPTHTCSIAGVAWYCWRKVCLGAGCALLEATQLLLLKSSCNTDLEPALCQSACFQSQMNMQSRKLI